MRFPKINLFIIVLSLLASNLNAQNRVTEGNTTTISISIPAQPNAINPMIYGQMLEDCNDKVIYGGIVNNEGK